MGRLRKLTTIVYGASGPVGAGIALALGREGSNVVVHYNKNEAAAADIVARIEAGGSRALALSADITDEAALNGLLKRTLDQFGAVDCVVNSAHGAFEPKAVADLEWDDWRVHLDAQKGHFLICKTVLPIMRRQGSGRLVFVSGGLSHRLYAGFSAFSTVKAGLNAFSKTLALEEGRHGITINIVAPGKVSDSGAAPTSDPWLGIEKHQLAAAPLGRYATGADVAEAVLFFLSPTAAGMTGQVLFVAGGEVMA
jgi:3-oxoacyl-[acyl-carrier protein] reductase